MTRLTEHEKAVREAEANRPPQIEIQQPEEATIVVDPRYGIQGTGPVRDALEQSAAPGSPRQASSAAARSRGGKTRRTTKED